MVVQDIMPDFVEQDDSLRPFRKIRIYCDDTAPGAPGDKPLHCIRPFPHREVVNQDAKVSAQSFR